MPMTGRISARYCVSQVFVSLSRNDRATPTRVGYQGIRFPRPERKRIRGRRSPRTEFRRLFAQRRRGLRVKWCGSPVLPVRGEREQLVFLSFFPFHILPTLLMDLFLVTL